MQIMLNLGHTKQGMNNKELFIDGYLQRISKEYPQSGDSKKNLNLAFEIFAIAAVLDKPFQEVFDNTFIKGDRDSAVYRQLLHAYRIYRYIQNQKKEYDSQYGSVSYADELIAYGIYKYLTKSSYDGNVFQNKDKLREAYLDTVDTIESIVKTEKKQHLDNNKTFSYSAYFKKPKSKVDFNNAKGILESDTLYEDLKHIR